jgi:aminoglycoside/choline kinase family phosphotransferase
VNKETHDIRLDRLWQWLREVLGRAPERIEALAGDASFRRYLRVHHGQRSFVAMDAPPEREDCHPYVRVAAALSALGLSVPQILASDLSQGFLLLSDLGDETYLGGLNVQTADQLYGDAISALIRMQSLGKAMAAELPDYDHKLLLDEMRLFDSWYLARHLGYELTARQRQDLEAVYSYLAAQALAQPRVFVHRDYHSRNLMILPLGNPGILDFQDAVQGPLTYDLVSLLRDCYIHWPAERVQAWLEEYYQQASQHELIADLALAEFQRLFDCMGVQRHLKAIGIFARLQHRDGKSAYLPDIPRTLDYVREVCPRHAPLLPLAELIAELSSYTTVCAS